MRKIITSPLIYLFLVLCIFYSPFFIFGKLPIPADTIIGLYHPYRDIYAKTNPNGIAYKNPLITDPVRQEYPWKYFAIEQIKKGRLPTWNPYTFSGAPFIANFQSAVFYPLNMIFFLCPFPIAWSVFIILQSGLACLFFYIFLMEHKVDKWAAGLGGYVFAFSGFSVAWLEWGTILQTILWLPLILFATERLLKKISWKFCLLFIFAQVSMFFAGHLQTYIYACVVSNLYLLARMFSNLETKKQRFRTFLKTCMPFFFLGIGIVILTLIQWMPTIHFILTSARDIDQRDVWQQSGWFIPWQNLVQFIIPDYFGNPATGNYWGIWNYAEFIGYVGIVPLLFSLFCLFTRRDKKTVFFGCIGILALFLSLPNPISKIPFILHIPFLSSTQPTRLIGITDFCLAILCALGMDRFMRKERKQIFLPLFLVVLLFAGVSLYTWIILGKITSIQNISVSKHNLLFSLGLFIVAFLVMTILSFVKQKRASTVLLGCLLILSVFDLSRFSQKFTPFTPKEYLYPSTRVLQYLQENLGNYRVMSLDSQILPPNMSLMYNLQSIEGYDPLYLLRYGEIIIASERSKPDINPPFGFNRIITPHTMRSDIMNLLGVKYVLSLNPDIVNSSLRKVFNEGETTLYENTQVLPRAFFATTVTYVNSKQAAIQKLFSTGAGREAIVESDSLNTDNVTSGTATIISYTPEKISIKTENKGIGFLILTDSFYDTWKATLDNTTPVSIYRTDYAFRGVFIPSGEHTIMFYNGLL